MLSSAELLEEFQLQTGIYHERQKQLRCGQHTLNNLLQENRFTYSLLKDIAENLDSIENEVHVFKNPDEQNMEETGYSNIQVLQEALKTCKIELIALKSQHPEAKNVVDNMELGQAYICNVLDHCVPAVIHPDKLIDYLKSYENLKPSIFLVYGELGECEADRRFRIDGRSLIDYCKPFSVMIREQMKTQISQMEKLKNLKLTVPRELLEKLEENPKSQDALAMLKAYLPDAIDHNTIRLTLPSRRKCGNLKCEIHHSSSTGQDLDQFNDFYNSDDFDEDQDLKNDKETMYVIQRLITSGGTRTQPDGTASQKVIYQRRILALRKASLAEELYYSMDTDYERAIEESLKTLPKAIEEEKVPKKPEKLMQGFLPKSSEKSKVNTSLPLDTSSVVNALSEPAVVLPTADRVSITEKNMKNESSSSESSVAVYSLTSCRDAVQKFREQRRLKFGNRDVSIILPVDENSES